MRRFLIPGLVLTLSWSSSAHAEDLEAFVLRDGREVVGRYDEATGKLHLRSGKGGTIMAAIQVAPADIVKRSPWVDPAEAAKKRAAEEAARKEAERVLIQRAEATAAKEREAKARQAKAQAQEEARIRADEQMAANLARANDRARYWEGLGMHFDPSRMSADEMDRAGQGEVESRERRRKEEEARQEAARAMEGEFDHAATVRKIVEKSVATPNTLAFIDLRPVHLDPATGERVWRVEFDSVNAFGVLIRTRMLLPWQFADDDSAIWSFDPVGLAQAGDATPRSIRQAVFALRKARAQIRR